MAVLTSIKVFQDIYLILALVLLNYHDVLCSKICEETQHPEVRHFDIRIPETTVPAKTTFYVCQMFKIPDEDTFHAIAFEPLISKSNMVHHMLLFGCDFEPTVLKPHECSSYDGRCRSWLAQWTLGVEGQICTDKNAGVRFGKDSYKYMALQIHWNNEEMLPNVTDNSGIRIFYTTKLRTNDVGNVQIGQNDLDIPPMSINHEQDGGCSGTCTRLMLPHPIYLTRTYIHMHYLGARGALEIYRDGHLVTQVAEDKVYNYNPSPIHVHDVPVQVKPGDEVRLKCWFDSFTGPKARNHTIYWGEGSDAEMCYAFVTYYPKVQGFDQCIQFDKYDINCPTENDPPYGGCNFSNFQTIVRSITSNIIKACDEAAFSGTHSCDSDCYKEIKILLSQKCMKDRLGVYAKRLILPSVPGWAKLQQHLNQFKMKCI